MGPGAIIAVSVVCSIIGLILVVLILMNILCLWQAKPCPRSDIDTEDVDGCVKWHCMRSHYHVHTYIGCLPGPKRPWKRLGKLYGYSIRRPWFTMCYCCQEMNENEEFLDEVFAPPAVLTAPARLDEKRPELIHASRSRVSTERESSDLDVPSVPNRASAPKLSILAPDPIMVHMDYTPTQSPIQEDTEPVSFYVFQLEGKAGERMLY